MEITFDWLKDHLKTNLKEELLLEKLTNVGLEVESIENLSEGLDLFKVAKIIKTEPELVLKSRNVIPKRLLDNGFQFKFETIQKTFKNLLS